ncbi:dienelactone hydrolase family protein [Zavarzinia sp. CC-PAN008]|uniref:dienelactone hydrolase family protein n=1 Tax=Zavarzinia sp. CC-PAN008 TaxID=3243332 RepID=UPI003F7483F7
MMDLDEELQRLASQAMSRRSLLATGIAVGFTLAAGPVAASAIATSADGLVAGPITIDTGTGELPAYRARPAGDGPFPIVLVVQEIFGVHAYIQDVCRRLAHQGYCAVATELFARQGDVSGMTDIDAIRAIVAKVPDEQVMADLDATVVQAGLSEHGDASRLGILGFCWGGRIVWLYAAHAAALDAGVAFYGRLKGTPDPLHPKSPLDLAGEMKAPVLGLYGGQDEGIPVSDVEAMDAALKAAGKQAEFQIFPNAAHGFHADYRAAYDPDAAADAFSRAVNWLKTHGAG